MHHATLLGLSLYLAGASPPDRPSDPDTAPFMPAPAGQPRRTSARYLRFDGEGGDLPPRLQLSVEPLYAAFRAPFVGRPADAFIHGGGVALDLDVALRFGFGLRVRGSYSGHPVSSIYEERDGERVQVAPSGRIDNAEFAGAILYALDIGRVLPLLELGLGAFWIVTPVGVTTEQRDQACGAEGSCDVGLHCDPDQVCRPGPSFTLHFGAGIDMRLHDHVSVGIGARYYAFVTAPGTFPIYLQALARCTARF